MKFLKFKISNLLKSSFVIFVMTFLSRISGFLRDLVLANLFGATVGMDVFLVAGFKIPNFMRRLFAEGAFSQAFVPILSEYKEKRSFDEIKLFLSNIAGSLFVVLAIFTSIAMILAPVIITIFAPGFLHDHYKMHLAINLLRITFPYLVFISLTACAGGILNCYGAFGVPAFTSTLLNLAMIATAIILAPHLGITAAAIGVTLGGVFQLLFQIPFLKKKGLLPKFKVNFKDKGVVRVLKLMFPAVLGVSMAQIGIFIDTLFASFLQNGSISWLYYSDRLTNLPLGVFGVAIATVILPNLSSKKAKGSLQAYSETLDWAVRSVLFIAIPAVICLFFLASPLLATLFLHGKFLAQDVVMSTKSLQLFAFGVPTFMLVKIFAAGFYSQQDIKTPVKIVIISTIANIIFNVIFIFPLKHGGLALSTVLASMLNAGLLLYLLIKRKIYQAQMNFKKYAMQLLVSAGVMGTFFLFFRRNLVFWVSSSHLERIVYLFFLLGVGGILYLVSLFLTGVRLKDFNKTI